MIPLRLFLGVLYVLRCTSKQAARWTEDHVSLLEKLCASATDTHPSEEKFLDWFRILWLGSPQPQQDEHPIVFIAHAYKKVNKDFCDILCELLAVVAERTAKDLRRPDLVGPVFEALHQRHIQGKKGKKGKKPPQPLAEHSYANVQFLVKAQFRRAVQNEARAQGKALNRDASLEDLSLPCENADPEGALEARQQAALLARQLKQTCLPRMANLLTEALKGALPRIQQRLCVASSPSSNGKKSLSSRMTTLLQRNQAFLSVLSEMNHSFCRQTTRQWVTDVLAFLGTFDDIKRMFREQCLREKMLAAIAIVLRDKAAQQPLAMALFEHIRLELHRITPLA